MRVSIFTLISHKFRWTSHVYLLCVFVVHKSNIKFYRNPFSERDKLSAESKNPNLETLRLKIVKSMLAEFPELRIQISKSIMIEPLKTKPDLGDGPSQFNDYLSSIANNSRNYHLGKSRNSSNSKNSEESGSIKQTPTWAKLAMASTNNKTNDKYYVFK